MDHAERVVPVAAATMGRLIAVSAFLAIPLLPARGECQPPAGSTAAANTCLLATGDPYYEIDVADVEGDGTVRIPEVDMTCLDGVDDPDLDGSAWCGGAGGGKKMAWFPIVSSSGWSETTPFTFRADSDSTLDLVMAIFWGSAGDCPGLRLEVCDDNQCNPDGFCSQENLNPATWAILGDPDLGNGERYFLAIWPKDPLASTAGTTLMGSVGRSTPANKPISVTPQCPPRLPDPCGSECTPKPEQLIGATGHGRLGGGSGYEIIRGSIAEVTAGVRFLNPGPSFRLEPGWNSAFPPPGEVQMLRFDSVDQIRWDPERGGFRYGCSRGDIGTWGPDFGMTEEIALAQPTTYLYDEPAPGAGSYYLCSSYNRLGEPGPRGPSYPPLPDGPFGPPCP